MRFKLFPATLPETFRKLVLAVLLRISSECFDNPIWQVFRCGRNRLRIAVRRCEEVQLE